MTTFPKNPAVSLKLMEIAIDLESIQSESIFADAIRQAVKAGRVVQIVKEIAEQAKDNRDLVSDIVGEKVLVKIEKLYL